MTESDMIDNFVNYYLLIQFPLILSYQPIFPLVKENLVGTTATNVALSFHT